MKPIIYSSHDAGAPQLSMTAGALNTVIKGCLITGYGDKAAAGWEMAHEDMSMHKLSIRSTNEQSIKSVLLLNDSAASAASMAAYNDWDYETSTGLDPFANGYCRKAWGGSYNADWLLVATDKFFYLHVQNKNASYGAVTGFGDAVSFDDALDYSVLMSHASKTGEAETDTAHKGVHTNQHCAAIFPAPPFPSIYGYWGDRTIDDNVWMSDITLFCQCALYLEQTKKQPKISLPGLLMPYSPISTGLSDLVVINNIRRLYNQTSFRSPLLGMYQWKNGHIWLQLDDWG